MKFKTSYLILETDNPVQEGANKLRGFVIGGIPSILGVDEGAEVVKMISGTLDKIVLGKNSYKVEQKVLYERESELKPDRMSNYKFVTPWVGLNSKNYQIFSEGRNWKEKKLLLNRILVGNILSMCKGLGVIANRRLEVHSHLDTEMVYFKGLEVLILGYLTFLHWVKVLVKVTGL